MTAKRTNPIGQAKSNRHSSANRRLPFGLTPRENDVMRLVAKGKMDKEIAAQLAMSCGTVHNRLHCAFVKLKAGTRTEAAIKWLNANSS